MLTWRVLCPFRLVSVPGAARGPTCGPALLRGPLRPRRRHHREVRGTFLRMFTPPLDFHTLGAPSEQLHLRRTPLSLRVPRYAVLPCLAAVGCSVLGATAADRWHRPGGDKSFSDSSGTRFHGGPALRSRLAALGLLGPSLGLLALLAAPSAPAALGVVRRGGGCSVHHTHSRTHSRTHTRIRAFAPLTQALKQAYAHTRKHKRQHARTHASTRGYPGAGVSHSRWSMFNHMCARVRCVCGLRCPSGDAVGGGGVDGVQGRLARERARRGPGPRRPGHGARNHGAHTCRG